MYNQYYFQRYITMTDCNNSAWCGVLLIYFLNGWLILTLSYSLIILVQYPCSAISNDFCQASNSSSSYELPQTKNIPYYSLLRSAFFKRGNLAFFFLIGDSVLCLHFRLEDSESVISVVLAVAEGSRGSVGSRLTESRSWSWLTFMSVPISALVGSHPLLLADPLHSPSSIPQLSSESTLPKRRNNHLHDFR